jgi:Ca2+-binding RTX toxin-like protein
VNFTLIQGTATANGSLTGLGSDVLRRARIERAELTGRAGDNRIDASAFTGRTWLRGGGGDDTLKGGSSTDLLLGGDGDEDLDGPAGRDLLAGGLGADVLTGAAGSNLLAGGTTAHDGNPDPEQALTI